MEFGQLQQRIVERWVDIQSIASTVLPASTIVDLLGTVGAPNDWKSLGLEARMIEPALRYAHYIRNRFTVLKLFKMIGLPPFWGHTI